jgi:hypothetical protein
MASIDVSCFNKLVFIPGCAVDDENEYQYSILEFPGISELFGENVANLQTDQNAMDLFARILKTAKKVMIEDFTRLVATENLFEFDRFIYSENLSQYTKKWETAITTPITNGIDINWVHWFRNKDQYLDLVITDIQVLFLNTGAFDLVITDGTFVTTIPVTVEANVLQTIKLDYRAVTSQVKLTYTGNNLMPNENLLNGIWGGCNDQNLSLNNWYQGVFVQGYEMNNFVKTTSQSMHGLNPRIALQCSKYKWLCSFADSFALALANKVATLLMKEAKYSSRINYYVNDKSKLEELRAMYQADYEKEISSILYSIKPAMLKSRSQCINCLRSRIITRIP